MTGGQTHAPVQPVAAKALGDVERGIVRDRRSVYLIGDSPCLQRSLNAGEFRHGQRALERVVAARVEENDDGGVTSEKFLEGDRRALVIFEYDPLDRVAAATQTERPGESAAKTVRQ